MELNDAIVFHFLSELKLFNIDSFHSINTVI